jgi:hypothetical protein
MPRKPRIHVPGAFYHVMLRGNHRQDIFFTQGDRQLLSDAVAEVTRTRAWIAHQASTLRTASIAHIAHLFGRDESTLRKSVLRYFGLQ